MSKIREGIPFIRVCTHPIGMSRGSVNNQVGKSGTTMIQYPSKGSLLPYMSGVPAGNTQDNDVRQEFPQLFLS